VAATAFGVAVAPLDVNVRRVISRIAGVDPGSRHLQGAADDLVARQRPRRWLNAVMDLAAGVCTRTGPRCGDCPVQAMCASRGAVVSEDAGSREGGAMEAPRRSVPFHETTRWLRGRLVASLTGAPGDMWLPLPDRLGTHDREAIVAAARSLEREGFLELFDGHARVRP
jgi:A/G-specific adenine glycosylase